MINENELYWDKEVQKDSCRFCAHNAPKDGGTDVYAYIEGTCTKDWKSWSGNHDVSAARDQKCYGRKFEKAQGRRFDKEIFRNTPRNVLEAMVSERHDVTDRDLACMIFRSPVVPIFITVWSVIIGGIIYVLR